MSWPVPTQPYASAVSENLTLADTIANSTASAGAMPMPAMNSVTASHQKSMANAASAGADEDDEHATGGRPRADRHVAEEEAAGEAADREDGEHDAGFGAVVAERGDDAGFDGGARADEEEPDDRREHDRRPAEHDAEPTLASAGCARGRARARR